MAFPVLERFDAPLDSFETGKEIVEGVASVGDPYGFLRLVGMGIVPAVGRLTLLRPLLMLGPA